MLARWSLYLAYLVFCIGLSGWIDRHSANVIEKSLFLWASLAFLVMRPFRISIAILMMATLCMIFVLGAITPYPDFSWSVLLLSLNQILIVYALLAVYVTRVDAMGFMALSALIPSLCGLIGYTYQFLGKSPAWSIEYSTGLPRFSGSLIPAFMSGLAMCGTFAALQLAAAHGKRGFYAFVFVNFIILAIAGGRAPLAVTIFVCGSAVFLNPGISSKSKLYIGFGGLCMLLVIAVLFGQSLAARFMTSGDNGRLIIWDYLTRFMQDYPLTGIGFGHQYPSIPRSIYIISGSAAAHNDFIRMTVELGYVGSILFYALLTWAVIIRVHYTNRIDWTTVICYLGVLFISRTDNVLANPCFLALLVISALSGDLIFNRSKSGIIRKERVFKFPI